MSATMKSAELKSIAVRGTPIAYRELGATHGVPLVLLHHITAVIDDWDPDFVDALAKGRRVIAFDNAGVGASDGVVPGSIEEMADTAVAFIDALGLTKVDLLGYSMGGFVAQVVTARRPDLVRKMILASTGAAGGPGIDRIWDVLQEAFAFAEREKKHPKQRLFFKDSKASQGAAALFLARLQRPFTMPDRAIGDEAIQSQVKAFITWGKSPDRYTSAITIPTFIAAGDSDEMIPLANAVDLATKVRGSRLAVYPDASHGAIFQHKETFVEHVNDFLNHRSLEGRLP